MAQNQLQSRTVANLAMQALTNPDIQQALIILLSGIGQTIAKTPGDKARIVRIASDIQTMAPFVTGLLFANTPQAHLVDQGQIAAATQAVHAANQPQEQQSGTQQGAGPT